MQLRKIVLSPVKGAFSLLTIKDFREYVTCQDEYNESTLQHLEKTSVLYLLKGSSLSVLSFV